MTTTETWKSIPDFPHYEASDHGRIRSIARTVHGKQRTRRFKETVLRPGLSKNGYHHVTLFRDGIRYRSKWVHRLVLLTFNGPSILEVNHKNGLKTDAHLHNLEYVTRSDNEKHSNRVLGKKSYMNRAKITEADSKEIRRLHAGGIAQPALASQYKLHQSHISRIVNMKRWNAPVINTF